MSPQEINEAVAKKLGWEEYEGKDPDFRGNYDPKKLWRKNGKDSVRVLPDYCGWTAAAWEVVEFINKRWNFTIGTLGNKGYRAEFNDRKGKLGYRREDADTAPMAICLAFLKLK